jgi:hypothetical protein
MTIDIFLDKAETIPFPSESLVGLFCFPTCPGSFETYLANADWLDQSLLKSLLFGLLSL